MLIFAPIDQTGWRSAASGVARGHLLEAGGAERAARGGQHDLLHRAAVAVGQRLEDRVVLGIDRQQRRAGLGTARSITSPAQTSASLLASATRRRGGSRPASAARPAAPVIAAMVQSAGSGGRLDHGLGAGGDLDAGAGQRLAQRGVAGRVGDHGAVRRCSAMACSASSAALRPATRARTRKRSGAASQQVDGLGADAAGAAQDGDACAVRCRHCHSTTPRPSQAPAGPRHGAAASSASSRRATRHGRGSAGRNPSRRTGA